jgi:rhodanese-related sulfurtransferase
VTEKKAPATQSSLDHSGNTMQVLGGANLLATLQQQNSATACSEAEAKERQPKMIGTPQAKELYGDSPQAVFVDVRPAKAFQSGHIPGAVNLPIDSFEKDWHQLPKNKTIVLYQSGHSTGDVCAASRSAGRILLTQGFGYSAVKVYRDGLAGWTKAGLPVKR